MILHRLLGDGQRVGHFLVRHALRDVVEDLNLPRREWREDVRRAGTVHRKLAEFRQHLRRDRRPAEDLLVDDELAAAHFANGVDELRRLAILVQVCGRSGADGLEQDLLLVLGREDHDRDRGQLTPHALGRLDAGKSRKVDLDDEDVGFELVGLRHGLLAVRRDAHDLHIRLFVDDLPDAHGRNATRIREQDPDRALGLLVHECS